MDLLDYFFDNTDVVVSLAIEHLLLCLAGIGIALPFAILFTAVSIAWRRFSFPLLTFAGFLYTIPSFALLALLIPSQGVGNRPTLVMLILYCQIFLMRNFIAAFRGVDNATLEAARGLGMNSFQVFLRVWLPLALPVVVAGFRITLVAAIGLAAIGSWIGADGLGQLIFDGLGRLFPGMILAGVIGITLLAIVADILLRVIERFTPLSRAIRAGMR